MHNPEPQQPSHFPVKIPSAWQNHLHHPALAKQVQWHPDEQQSQTGFDHDPVKDERFSPLPGLIHKYHRRVLWLVSGHCDIHCRYCFRRHVNYADHVSPQHDAGVMDYIRTHRIQEVILSGGDPLALPPARLENILNQLQDCPSIKWVRIHSRSLCFMPQKLPLQWVEAMVQAGKQLCVVLHFNHSDECFDSATSLFKTWHHWPMTVLNQSVLLKDINDDVDVLEQLSHRLYESGVLPYYLNVLDQVAGATQFAVSLAKAQQLHEQLQCRLPGYLVPKLVRDMGEPSHKYWVNLDQNL